MCCRNLEILAKFATATKIQAWDENHVQCSCYWDNPTVRRLVPMSRCVSTDFMLSDGWGMVGIWTQNFVGVCIPVLLHSCSLSQIMLWPRTWLCTTLQRPPMTEMLTPEFPIGIPSCLGILALSSFLRTFRLSLVLVQPDHDFRSHTAWKRVLVLFAFLHHRQDIIIHRSSGIERDHRRLTEW